MPDKPGVYHNLDEAMSVVRAVAGAIRELKEVPSGILYASLKGKIDHETYMAVLGTMLKAGVIKAENHMIYWTGR